MHNLLSLLRQAGFAHWPGAINLSISSFERPSFHLIVPCFVVYFDLILDEHFLHLDCRLMFPDFKVLLWKLSSDNDSIYICGFLSNSHFNMFRGKKIPLLFNFFEKTISKCYLIFREINFFSDLEVAKYFLAYTANRSCFTLKQFFDIGSHILSSFWWEKTYKFHPWPFWVIFKNLP